MPRFCNKRRYYETTRGDFRGDIAGVYRFYSTETGPVKYVGRSDTDLYSEILRRWRFKETRARLVYLDWTYCRNAREAYELECREYHRHEPELNDIHPRVPEGYIRPPKCPVCG